ncbi:MFS-type transporter SLC18B1 [Halotydeus destructor]|nr:MFS-type transporter SLC18B1 [Halotydeus destructor]
MTGVAQIVFGALDFMEDTVTFTYSCAFVRAMMSTGAAICLTCAIYLIFHRFPGHLNFAFAIQETAIGLGEALGPQLADACRNIAGYSLPFYVTGFFSLAVLPCLWYEENQPQQPKKSNTIQPSKLLNIELLPIVFAVVTIGVSHGGFTEPTLAPHLDRLSISGNAVSIILSGFALSYTMASLLTGTFADGYKQPKILMIAGLAISAMCYLCLGPLSWVITGSFESKFISMLVLGAFLGVSSVPSFGILLESLRIAGYEDNEETYSIVSSLWLTSYTFGEFLGTSVSGYLVDHFGFDASTQVVALLNVVSFMLLGLQLFLPRNHVRRVEVFSMS